MPEGWFQEVSFPFPLCEGGHEMLLSLGSWEFSPFVSNNAHGLFLNSYAWIGVSSSSDVKHLAPPGKRTVLGVESKRKGASVLISSIWRSFLFLSV